VSTPQSGSCALSTSALSTSGHWAGSGSQDIRVPWEPEAATKAILAGTAPDGIAVVGEIDLSESDITRLPSRLRCTKLILDKCTHLVEFPSGLECFELQAQDLFITELPSLKVSYRMDLSGCFRLASIPEDLEVGTLVLRGCTSLVRLPDGLTVNFLDVTSCTALTHLPTHGAVRGGRLLARGCDRLETIPSWLTTVGRLDVSECPLITDLPAGIEITDWLDIGGSGVTSVEDPDVAIHWRGVHVSHRVAFQPETIQCDEVLRESNLEVRRVLLERLGYARFLEEVGAKELDTDTDPGGKRRLLTVAIPNDEPLVVLAVSCPSTQRQYLLRVPPKTTSCHEAAAWIAGFDDPALYQPLMET
jgi:hypothetical protein